MKNGWPSRFKPHPLGHVAETADCTVFFGDRRSALNELVVAFPDFEFRLLKQTHSDTVIASRPGDRPEADAHFTRQRRIALCVQTADCMPVMIHSPDDRTVAAVHAGWRGIENGIIVKTCLSLGHDGAPLKNTSAWIGPHIGSASFEVQSDVASLLNSALERVRGYAAGADSPIIGADGKTHVDLALIARAQLSSRGINSNRLSGVVIDTMASSEFFSFRRDRERAGRQISFIALK